MHFSFSTNNLSAREFNNIYVSYCNSVND